MKLNDNLRKKHVQYLKLREKVSWARSRWNPDGPGSTRHVICVVNQRHWRGSRLGTTSSWEDDRTRSGGQTVVVQAISFAEIIEGHRRLSGRTNHQIPKLHAFDERAAVWCPERTCHRTAIAGTNAKFEDAGLNELSGESIDVIHTRISGSIRLGIS